MRDVSFFKRKNMNLDLDLWTPGSYRFEHGTHFFGLDGFGPKLKEI